MNQLVTSLRACELLDMPRSTLTFWVRRKAVRPIIPAAKSGSPRVFTVKQIWAVAIAKAVRAGGQSVETACDIAQILDGYEPKEIEQAFDEGRTCLFVINVDGSLTVMPRLVTADSITSNTDLTKVQKQAAKDGQTVQFYGIDTKPLLDQLIKEVESKT